MNRFVKFIEDVINYLGGRKVEEEVEEVSEVEVPLYEVGQPVRVLPSDMVAKRYWNRKGIVRVVSKNDFEDITYEIEMRNKAKNLLVFEDELEVV